MDLCGENLNQHLKSKLLSTADVQYHILDWVLQRDFSHMDFGKLEREVTMLFQKYRARQNQFAYLCALGVALAPFSTVLNSTHKLYTHLISMGATNELINALPGLGDLCVNFPKVAYLNITEHDYIRMKSSILNFFGDHTYSDLHKFWKSIDLSSIENDDDETQHNMKKTKKDIQMQDLPEMLRKMMTDLKMQLQESQKEYIKNAIMEGLKANLRNDIKELLDEKLEGNSKLKSWESGEN